MDSISVVILSFFQIGFFRRCDLGKITFPELSQIKIYQTCDYYQRRYAHRQLSYKLLEEYRQVSHFFKPKKIRYESDQAGEQR